MSSSHDEVRTVVRDLADGYGKQSKDSNRLWLASIAAAAVVLFPSPNPATPNLVNLPFSLATVPTSIFEPVGFGILFVLVMAYCQAYAHAHNAAHFAQKLLDKFERTNAEAKPREFYDILVLSSFARVWPLVDLFQTLYGRKRWLVRSYYILLKLLTEATLLGIPLLSLFLAYTRIFGSSPDWVRWPALLALVLVGIAVIEIIVAEIRYARRVVAKLGGRKKHDGAG
jgi:hypothetical protein